MKKTITLLILSFLFCFSHEQINTFPYNEDFEGASVLQGTVASCDATAGATFTDWTQDPTDGGDCQNGGLPNKLQIHALEVHDSFGVQMDPTMRVTLVFQDAVLRLNKMHSDTVLLIQ